ncbi:MAG: hypothetical protein N2167_01815 [Flavobacteriales bacterium]|nr:hypothetical protein [Flavobacteriales bacterium]
MKNLFIALISTVSIHPVFAQGLGELFGGGKKDKGNKETAQSVTVSPGANQYERIDAFMKANPKFWNFYYYAAVEKYEKEYSYTTESFFTNIQRNDKNQITSFEAPGPMYSSKFVVDNPDFPRYYKGDYGSLYFVGSYALWTRSYSGTDPKNVSPSWSLKDTHILTSDGSVAKGLKFEGFKKLLADYLADVDVTYQKYQNDLKAEKERIEKEKRAKGTTEGKNVTSLKLNIDKTKLKQGEFATFEIIAVLKDGTEISTKNGGYLDEYTIELVGLPEKYFSYTNFMMDYLVLAGNKFHVPMDKAVEGDQVVINVTNKFYPNAKVTKTIPIDYSATFIKLDEFKGYGDGAGCIQRYMANNRIELKQVKHAVTKEDLLEMKWMDLESGRILINIRFKPSAAVTVDVTGARGFLNAQCGSVRKDKSGTPGGNVTLVVDPSVKSYNISVLNDGGAGAGNLSFAGPKGQFTKLVEKVSW